MAVGESHTRVPLTLAIGDYDQVRDLVAGTVQPTGIDLTCLVFSRPEEIFFRFLEFREWDASEMSLAVYTARLSRGERDLTAIPVFPVRCFRHSAIYVRSGAGVHEPADLGGKRVGVPAWVQTAGVYARGVLVHEYGVALSDVDWYQAALSEPDRGKPVEVDVPEGVTLTRIYDRSLDEMLTSGDVDAVISARPPRAFEAGDGSVRRLIGDFVGMEREFYRTTGIFPIMHVVALRQDVVEADPWVGMNLLTAFNEAKRRSLARALDATVPRFPLPWTSAHAREALDLIGDDFWPYELEPNRVALEAFLDYAFEQRVAGRRVTCEELFPLTVPASVKA